MKLALTLLRDYIRGDPEHYDPDFSEDFNTTREDSYHFFNDPSWSQRAVRIATLPIAIPLAFALEFVCKEEPMKKAPKPALEGKLTAYDFSPQSLVHLIYEDGSELKYRHAFWRREGDWIAIYTEHCGYHMILSICAESITGTEKP